MSNTAGHRKRRRIWNRDKGKCFYCNKDVVFGSRDFTLDHVIPRSKGGPGATWNLVTCCLSCNAAKEDSDPEPEHLSIIRRREALAGTCIMLGRAFGHAKKNGDLETGEYLLALQRVTLLVLYGIPVDHGRYDVASPSFADTLETVWEVFRAGVEPAEKMQAVQVHDKRLTAVEQLLSDLTAT